MSTCNGKTKSGNPCRNSVTDQDYCRLHRDQVVLGSPEGGASNTDSPVVAVPLVTRGDGPESTAEAGMTQQKAAEKKRLKKQKQREQAKKKQQRKPLPLSLYGY